MILGFVGPASAATPVTLRLRFWTSGDGQTNGYVGVMKSCRQIILFKELIGTSDQCDENSLIDAAMDFDARMDGIDTPDDATDWHYSEDGSYQAAPLDCIPLPYNDFHEVVSYRRVVATFPYSPGRVKKAAAWKMAQITSRNEEATSIPSTKTFQLDGRAEMSSRLELQLDVHKSSTVMPFPGRVYAELRGVDPPAPPPAHVEPPPPPPVVDAAAEAAAVAAEAAALLARHPFYGTLERATVRIVAGRQQKMEIAAAPAIKAEEERMKGVVQEDGPFPVWWTDDNKRALMERAAAYFLASESAWVAWKACCRSG